MAIVLRSSQQIAKMREAGRLVADTFEMLRPHIRPGVTTKELDRMAEKYIRGHGAVPVYKGYRGPIVPFPATICVAVNNVICHGFPSNTPLREGDIVGVDIGARLDGWVGDSCVTYAVGERKSANDPLGLFVRGIDKQVVGEEAAKIRGLRPPEPYKGKGIKYLEEKIRRKAGKAGKAK